MEKLNVRFPDELVLKLQAAGCNYNVTASAVARAALCIGLDTIIESSRIHGPGIAGDLIIETNLDLK